MPHDVTVDRAHEDFVAGCERFALYCRASHERWPTDELQELLPQLSGSDTFDQIHRSTVQDILEERELAERTGRPDDRAREAAAKPSDPIADQRGEDDLQRNGCHPGIPPQHRDFAKAVEMVV